MVSLQFPITTNHQFSFFNSIENRNQIEFLHSPEAFQPDKFKTVKSQLRPCLVAAARWQNRKITSLIVPASEKRRKFPNKSIVIKSLVVFLPCAFLSALHQFLVLNTFALRNRCCIYCAREFFKLAKNDALQNSSYLFTQIARALKFFSAFFHVEISFFCDQRNFLAHFFLNWTTFF